ncbi:MULTISPECIES: alpha/beta hydrolase [unclassified Streptomyces]|uniref:alpha/beta fold hydrolase n=1 Tax=unclassified Streptomyces TaxID=2593676 RepID=UPI0006860CF8|nr:MULTISPECIES: alpha/beta hydrolase [unclassified Streptomyces]MYT33301.1 alpha/beta fold hydrolase [Streptomyces sp. SID8354]
MTQIPVTQIPVTQSPSVSLPPLSTTVAGPAGGPGVLLAHGATGSVRDNYGTLIPALTATGHRVVAPDYPGSGETPRATGPLELDALADAVVAEAVAAGLETFTVIGFSMGTAVSVRAAARHPERVRGLVLTAGLAKADARVHVWLDLWLRLLERGDYQGFAQARALSGVAPEYLNTLPPAELATVLDPDPTLPPAGSAEQAALVKALDTTADLPGIAVPTLVIATTLDALLDPANSRYLADHIPGAEYAEIATGHLPMVERNAEWLALIGDFLAARGL